MIAEYMTTPIRSARDAEMFVRALSGDGKAFHFDDSPIGLECFTPSEARAVARRVAEMRKQTEFEPFALLQWLENGRPECWLDLDTFLLEIYRQGLDAEQRACLESSERVEEARGMLDDMQARLFVPGDLIARCIAALDLPRDWE